MRLKRSWRLALVTSCHVPSRGDGEDIVCQELGLLLHDGVTTEHLVLTTKMVGTVKYLTRLCIIIDNFLKYLLFFLLCKQRLSLNLSLSLMAWKISYRTKLSSAYDHCSTVWVIDKRVYDGFLTNGMAYISHAAGVLSITFITD